MDAMSSHYPSIIMTLIVTLSRNRVNAEACCVNGAHYVFCTGSIESMPERREKKEMNDKAGERITDARAWRGAELADGDWITHLSIDETKALYDMADALPSDDSAWLDH